MQKTLFDFDWKFCLGDHDAAHNPTYDDSTWRSLDVPHDWSIEGDFREDHATGARGGYLPAGIGWYRKQFRLDLQERGRKAYIEFEGVYMNSDVWINGYHLGKRPYGYSSFTYDMTPFLKYGEEANTIAVRVDNSAQPGSRWYSGSGIYRHVHLLLSDPLHIVQNGTYVTTPQVSAESAQIRVRTRIRNHYTEAKACRLSTTIIDPQGRVVTTASSGDQIASISMKEFDQVLIVEHPQLWSLSTPSMYTAKSEVQCEGKVVDQYTTPLGIRTIAFTAEKGFFLNGEPVKIQGVCLHHDNGPLGAVCLERAVQRKLEIMKAMGCNAIRCSHNPPSPALLDLCDQMGLLVMDEAFDEWKDPKAPMVFKDGVKLGRKQIKAYAQYFDEWAERDMTDMIIRDRNHPSIILWSIGNEIRESHMPQGPELAKSLAEIVHRVDPTRPTVSAIVNMPGANKVGFPQALDVVGYNYKEFMYEEDRALYPDRIILGSENRTANPFLPRGCYDGLMQRQEDKRVQEGTASWRITKDNDYAAGVFLWTGFDYFGEPTPHSWPSRSSYFGVVDLAGFPKDEFYFYQSQWTQAPMLHIFPHWNWSQSGQVIPVWCYSNCDTVELFLNGTSLGEKKVTDAENFYLIWQVSYQSGTLKAVSKRDGMIACEQQVTTAGAPAAISLAVDRKVLAANGQDLAYITVKVLDAAGHLVPDSQNCIRFRVEGAGRLVGLENGDPTSHEPYKGDCRRVFHGLGLAVIQTDRQPGAIKVLAESKGLQAAEIEIVSLAK